MKTKKELFLIKATIICASLALFTIICYNYLTPITPLKIARKQSNLHIPKQTQVLKFDEQYSFTGEGYRLIILKLDHTTLNKMIENRTEKKYQELNRTNLISEGVISQLSLGYFIDGRDITQMINAYYTAEVNGKEICISIIDIDKKHLIVYNSFP